LSLSGDYNGEDPDTPPPTAAPAAIPGTISSCNLFCELPIYGLVTLYPLMNT